MHIGVTANVCLKKNPNLQTLHTFSYLPTCNTYLLWSDFFSSHIT